MAAMSPGTAAAAESGPGPRIPSARMAADQELVLEVREATWRLAQELGRMPTGSGLTRLSSLAPARPGSPLAG
jgi:hypothetical protein